MRGRAKRTEARLAPGVRDSRAGFSLVELVVTIAILALVAGTVMVDWHGILPRAKLNSTVHDLAAVIGGARSDAIARNGVFRIHYDLERNAYKLTSPYRLGGGLAQSEEERSIIREILFPDGVELDRVVVNGVEYKTGEVFVTFDPLGSASDHLITISQPTLGEFGTTYTIEVLPLTGQIRFHYQDFRREPVTEDDFR